MWDRNGRMGCVCVCVCTHIGEKGLKYVLFFSVLCARVALMCVIYDVLKRALFSGKVLTFFLFAPL